MMTKQQFARQIKKLNAVIPNKLEDKDSLEMYYEILSDLDENTLSEGIKLMLKEETSFYGQTPLPGLIRQYCDKVSGKDDLENRMRLDIILFGRDNLPEYEEQAQIMIENKQKPKELILENK